MAKAYSKELKENIVTDYKNGVDMHTIAEGYGKTYNAIFSFLYSHGYHKKKRITWTEEDNRYLKEHYPTDSWDDLLTHFSDRNKQSLLACASKLKIGRENYYWTKEEVDLLIKNYDSMSLNELAKLFPNRTIDSVATKALNLDMGFSKSRNWTNDEINIIKKYYPIISVDEVCKLLPKRTKFSVVDKAI